MSAVKAWGFFTKVVIAHLVRNKVKRPVDVVEVRFMRCRFVEIASSLRVAILQ